jgi:hypothetical protein
MSSQFDISAVSHYRPRTMRQGLLIAGAFSAILAGAAVAQKADPTDGPVDDQTAAVQALLDDDTLSRPSDITPEEKQRRAATMVGEMRDAVREGEGAEAGARGNRDVVQLTCVEPKLKQAKSLLGLAEQSEVRLGEAVADKADDVANHEFTKIALGSQRVRRIKGELGRCVGEAAIYTGDTEVDLEVSANMNSGDPTETPVPPLTPESPPFASKQ